MPDGELSGLFINAEIYLQYANQYLDPRQIDAVDPSSLLIKAGLMA
ncbi:hypothetical protein [Pseudomonas sp. A-RE-19]|nr:hypothetical protein [Pseudomonas sp. A-RE-19]